jgi:photosystem II stability/assembly factor-like uncharacterized protein
VPLLTLATSPSSTPQPAALSLLRPVAALLAAILVVALSALAPPCSAQGPVWQPLGLPGGDVISLAVSPNNTVYLGTADGHIFASSDAGTHWELRGRVGTRHDAVIQKLLVDRREDRQLLAAVWFQDVRAGGALYRSSDAGATWSVAGLSGEILRTVEQAPDAPEIFVAGTRGGVFRSTDSAESWQRISPAGDAELRNVDSVAIDPHDPRTIYAGTYHLPWKTTDAGNTWNAVAAGMIDDSDVMSLRVDATSSARIFASACSGIYRSENGGAAWTKLQGIPYSSRRTQAIVQDPRDPRVLYAATTEGLWLTRDGGESWTRTTPRDWVVNDLVVVPAVDAAAASPASSASRILLATEQRGVLLSNDAGVTFAPANDGFSHRITAELVSDPRDAQHLLAWMPGSPDALMESRDGGAYWQALPGASSTNAAGFARIFATDSGWWIANSQGVLVFYDSEDAKWTAFGFATALPRKSPGIRGAAHGRPVARALTAVAVVVPPDAASEIYDLRTIGARVYVATPQALWSGTLGQRFLRPVALSAIAPEDSSGDASSRLWMAAGGKVLFSADAGKTWREDRQQIAADVTGADVTGADVNRGDVRWIREVPVVAASGSPSGASPAIPQSASVLLAGTAKGLYRRDPNRETWQLVQNGLPAGEPSSFAFRDGLCVIAMRGGGLYTSRDASQTWDRLDTGAAVGPFTGVAVNASGQLLVASLTEGLLRVSSPLLP